MDHPDHEVELHFSQPVRQITFMVLVLLLVGIGAYIAYPRVASVFLANPWLNGFIGIVFIAGVVACFWQVVQLATSVSWIERFIRGQRLRDPAGRAPRLLAPLAALLRTRGAHGQISTTSGQTILDSVATRVDEERDITRYIVNLLIFLGLLGTFYGLATTVPAMVDTIRGLAPAAGESGVDVFGRLMTGLESQLGGMGVAFSSSLLGLAGSLVVGLLELFASHGQNRFFRELEEWLSTITRISFAGENEGGDTGMVGAALDHMAEQMDRLQQLFAQSEASRARVDGRLDDLAGALQQLAMQIDADNSATRGFERLAEGQERLAAALEASTSAVTEAEPPVDVEARMRLRSIDVQLLRILEELSAGRQEMLHDLRADLAALTRAIRQQYGGR
ncbi:MAG: biopolymer transporter ExbB [Paracoccaceae bacterium]